MILEREQCNCVYFANASNLYTNKKIDLLSIVIEKLKKTRDLLFQAFILKYVTQITTCTQQKKTTLILQSILITIIIIERYYNY